MTVECIRLHLTLTHINTNVTSHHLVHFINIYSHMLPTYTHEAYINTHCSHSSQ